VTGEYVAWTRLKPTRGGTEISREGVSVDGRRVTFGYWTGFLSEDGQSITLHWTANGYQTAELRREGE
jgi:hypothetical protein